MQKTALVTGASGGLGQAVAIELAKKHNHHILVHYRSNKAKAGEVVDKIKQSNGSAETIQFDVAEHEETKKALEGWLAEHDQKIEIVVNNAGINDDQLMAMMEQESWNRVIDASLQGFFNVTQPLLKQLIMNKWGRIINIVSLSGLKGVAGQANYSAAKGAVIAASRSLSQEVARKGITVNSVAPGFIKTEMLKDQDTKELSRMVPARRIGKPEEVAHLVAFLASDEAAYITGEVVNINGGIHGS